MRTLYCTSAKSFIDLLRPMLFGLDSLYWIAATQSRLLRHDWIGSPSEKLIFERWCMPLPAFKNTDLSLWRPGALSALDGNLVFDEWTYFIGFNATESEAPDRAARLGLSRLFSPEFYDGLTQEGQLFAVQVDGWWEFCTGTDALFAQPIPGAIRR